MLPDIDKIKGIHPGAILKRELRKRKIKSIHLSEAVDEHPQTINAITKERRGINPKLSFKLGQYFDTKEDYFMHLQASFDVAKYKNGALKVKNPLLGKFRKALFWDTNIELIDISKNRRAVIQRILERGNHKEIKELINIYSLDTIKSELTKMKHAFIPNFEKNVQKYILNNK